VLYDELARQMNGRLNNDVVSVQHNRLDYILYQWSLSEPWLLKAADQVINNAFIREGFRGNLTYCSSFKTNFTADSLPIVYRFDSNTTALEFDDRDGEVIAAPEIWDKSLLDGREMADDITNLRSPTKNVLLKKQRRG
jgi:hypothetical protein